MLKRVERHGLDDLRRYVDTLAVTIVRQLPSGWFPATYPGLAPMNSSKCSTRNSRRRSIASVAAKQLHRDEFVITSVDGAPDIVSAVRGDTLIQASAAQEPQTMAIEGIQLGYDIMNGKKPSRSTILIPSSLVTRDNAASYKGW